MGLALAVCVGCVAGERTEEYCDPSDGADGAQPALLLDLGWDVQPEADAFSSGTCELAGVDSMRWELTDQDGEPWSHGEAPCDDTLDLCDLAAGNYVLQIDGLDVAGETLWAARCEDLQLIRFDTQYRCNVPSQ
jgi:hypothetical protein